MNIFVGSLPFKVNEDHIRKFFEEYGEVSSVKIIIDKMSNRSKGFGFVEMPNQEEAKKAVAELNGAELEGRTIVVNESDDTKSSRPKGNFGGGGGYNRGGGGGYNREGNSGGYQKRY